MGDKPQAATRQPRSFLRRWRRRLLAGVILLAVLLWFAPLIVAHSPLRNWVARAALKDLRGSVRVGAAELGWFSPVVLRDVEVQDEQGQTVLVVPRAESDRTLLGLLADPSDMGTFRFAGPSLRVVFAGQRSNVERVVGPLFAPGEGGAAAPAITVEITAAKVAVSDEDTGRAWAVEGLDASLSLSRDGGGTLRGKLAGTVNSSPLAPRADPRSRSERTTIPGRVEAKVALELSGEAEDAQTGATVSIRADGFPLDLLGPLLRRINPALEIGGRLDAGLELRWDGSSDGLTSADVNGRVTVSGLLLAGAWPGGDRLRLAKVDLPCRMALRGSRIDVTRAELTCDLGTASVRGSLDTGLDLTEVLARPGISVTADVDLARLAEILPRTLRLREDTRLSAGRLSLSLRSAARPDGVTWEGALKTTALRGVSQGKPVARVEPVALDFTVRQPVGSPLVLDRLRCESSFLSAESSGTAEQWTVSARCDLDRLARQLSQFVDLGPIQPAGSGAARLTVRRDKDEGFRANVDAKFHRLALGGLTAKPVREENLTIKAEAAGHIGDAGKWRIDSAGVHLTAGADSADLRLTEAIPDLARPRSVKARCRAAGDLARWRRRLLPWVDGLEAWQFQGTGEASALLHLSPGEIRWEEGRVVLRDARCQGPGLWVNEPTVTLSAAGRFDTATGATELRNVDLTSAAVSLQSPLVRVAVSEAGQVWLDGTAEVRGDTARLLRWFHVPSTPPADVVGGSFAGQVVLRHAGKRQKIEMDLTARDVTFGPAAKPAWREPVVHVTGKAAYEPGADLLHIDTLRVASTALTCDARGKLARLSGSLDLSLAGHVDYDLEKLGPVLRPYLGDGVRVSGRGRRPFRVAGPLAGEDGKPALVALTGEASAGWASLEAFGCRCGPADLTARLGDGWLRLEPVRTTINEGRLRLEPSLRLGPGPAELRLENGTAIERTRITPAMCASAIRYALPALAGVAEAEGEISLNLDGGRIPLADPAAGDVYGRLTIHSARVGAGPLTRELAAVLLDGPPSVSLRKESVVKFRLVGGRVYHEGMELAFPGLTVHTTGNVGLDGSLSMVAAFPVPPKWLGGGRVNEALAKQTIRLPIGGTLDRPRIDPDALKAALARFTRDTVRDAARRELEKQLERLPRPRK